MNHILIVDDSPTIRQHLITVLSRAEFDAQAVGSGRAALASYKANRAALVILDVIMPEMDGLETLQALRTENREVKVLGISGIESQFSPIYLKMLRLLGAQAILEKPFSDELLIRTVRHLLTAPINSGPGPFPNSPYPSQPMDS